VVKKLRDSGHIVFAVNPNAREIDGEPCYPDLASLPDPVEAVFIATHPDMSAGIIKQCASLGIDRVWIHRSFGHGSVSDEAVKEAKSLGIDCIAGGCPMMYCAPVDPFHRCMRWILKLGHRVPA
jgi:predicted CoA-binding protein